MHRATPDRVPLRTVLSHVAVPILMGCAMALAYLGGFHHPTPHAVPVAVVGKPEVAGPVAARIQDGVGDALAVRSVPDSATAQDDLRHLRVAGAFVPGSKPELLVASGASESTASVVTKVFTAVAARQGAPLQVHDVVPLGEDDPIGQNGFFYLVPLSVASYATAIAIGAAGATRRFRERVGLLLAAGVVIATAMLTIATVGFGMFAGHGPAIWALSIVYSVAVLAIGVGLHPIVGRFCTILFSVVFVALNFTSSGGVFRPEMQPGLFGWLHEFWIGAGFLDATRRIVYLPETSLGAPTWILMGWLLVGGLCLVLGSLHERRVQALGHRLATLAALGSARRGEDGLTRREALDLELEEDVAV